MVGKVIGMFVGRSLAKKRGLNSAAGAAAGLIVPAVLKRIGTVAVKSGGAAIQARRQRRAPKYLRRIA